MRQRDVLVNIATSLSAGAKAELLQFAESGDIHSHEALLELERFGLIHSVGRGEDLTESGEQVVDILQTLARTEGEKNISIQIKGDWWRIDLDIPGQDLMGISSDSFEEGDNGIEKLLEYVKIYSKEK